MWSAVSIHNIQLQDEVHTIVCTETISILEATVSVQDVIHEMFDDYDSHGKKIKKHTQRSMEKKSKVQQSQEYLACSMEAT